MVFEYGEAATPCPPSWSREYNDSCDFDSHDDDTGAIEFTTELSALSSLVRQKPRHVKRATAFRIHEDTGDTTGGLYGRRNGESCLPTRRTTLSKGSSMFAQPAQRLPRPSKVNLTTSQLPKAKQRQTSTGLALGDGNRAPVKECPLSAGESVDAGKAKKGIDPLKRKKRRDTIYIPPEDTTMATVLMGAFSPPKTETLEAPQASFIEAQIAQRRKGNKIRTVLPGRAPLESPRRVLQEQAAKLDVAGKNTGKENMPPGHITGKFGLGKAKEKALGSPKPNTKRSTQGQQQQRSALTPSTNNTRNSLPARQNTSTLNHPVLKRSDGHITKESATGAEKSSPKKLVAQPLTVTSVVAETPAGRQEAEVDSKRSCVSDTKIETTPEPIAKGRKSLDLSERVKNIKQQHPVPIQAMLNPSLYEETWLTHQEDVITLLVNAVFESIHDASIESESTIKSYLGQLYQDTYFTVLYKRVQASLLHGELRVPKDIYTQGNRVQDDVGLRRKFLRLWVSTYNLSTLRLAVEVVAGQRIPIPEQKNSNGSSLETKKKIPKSLLRRRIEEFIERNILRNEDISAAVSPTPKAEEGGQIGRAYRMTLLRSTMIIALLDKAQSMLGSVLPRRLFQTNSEFKSSTAVLHALYKILQPSAGDIIRPFSRMDCVFKHKQPPLAEHEYWINNLAVDLRDGIILTRLAELITPPSSLAPNSLEGDVSVMIDQNQENWVHSRKLKTTSLNRVTKLQNVQIALDAMSSIPGVRAVAKNTRPEEIVDGYREKTVALLWAIACHWGLPALVDWEDLERETKRLDPSRRGGKHPNPTEDKTHLNAQHEHYPRLLRKWALSHVRADSSPDTLNRIDERVLSSIIDEHEPYISANTSNLNQSSPSYELRGEESTAQDLCLQSRLVSLGCSSQFASLAISTAGPSSSSTQTLVEDSDLVALAYLASRLLSATKASREATTIQRS